MYHVFSTLASSTKYVKYRDPVPGAHNVGVGHVLIKGGSGIHQKAIGTPLGVHTGVSEQDYEWLKDDPHFKQHVKNGYVTVRKAEVSPEIAAAEMVTFDRQSDACPVVPQEFSGKEMGNGLTALEPKTNKKSKAA